MSLFGRITKVEKEEQHRRAGLRVKLIKHILEDRRAENGLTAPGNPIQPKEGPSCTFPIPICTTPNEP